MNLSDLYKVIEELRQEKKRLDQLISWLEKFGRTAAAAPPRQARRRGRPHMSPEERRKVSERMKAYWAKRRAARQPGADQALPPKQPTS